VRQSIFTPIEGKVRGDLDRRIDVLEAKQRRINLAILAYVEADMDTTWMGSARELAAAIKESLDG